MRNLYKALLIISVALVNSSYSKAQDTTSFITKWDTRLGSATNDTIQFGALGDGFTLSYTEQGGSGYTGDTVVSSNPTVIFPEPGIYIVNISSDSGSFYGWNNYANTPAYSYSSDLLEIQQWGNTKWTYLSQGFRNSINMDVTATDVPDLTYNGLIIQGLFWNCPSLKNTNGSIGNWNVSKITNMNYMFSGASSFNQSLNNWDVSNVTDLGGMFYNATSFNHSLNSWNVSKVTTMYSMFLNATAFNQPLNNWDVSKVTDMDYMFANATNFNQPLNNWNVGNVSNLGGMFSNATSFNQPLNTWNISNATNLGGMFKDASSYNQNLGDWDLNSLTSADSMLTRSGLDCGNYSSTLSGWAANTNTPSGVKLGADNLSYNTSAQGAHDSLAGIKGWTISDAGSGGCSMTTPVKFGSLNASVQTSSVLLTWNTITEINNKGFNIQRSSDGINFTNIGYVGSLTADGNSSVSLSYTYTDATPLTGNAYYRLQQIDRDAKMSYSYVVSVKYNGINNKIIIYPNPAHGSITLTGLSIGKKANIYNISGHLIKTFVVSSASQQLDISDLSAGVYFVKSGFNNSTSLIVK